MIAHVRAASRPLSGTIDPPSSKNYTTRYVLASCLSAGRSVVQRPAVQDDAVALVRCARGMGARIAALDARGREVEFSVENAGVVDRLEIHGFGAHPRLAEPGRALDPGNAGAVFRMLLAASALLPEVRWETSHPESLGKRPHGDLVDALRFLGVEVECEGGRLPMVLRGGRERIAARLAELRREQKLADGEPVALPVSGEISSQFTSALLFLAPLLDADIAIHATGRLKSLAAVETTRQVLSMAGVGVESSTSREVHLVRRGQAYAPRTWETNGDWPGSSAILAAACAVPGSDVTLRRLVDDEQGERECVPFFRRMGCETELPPGLLRLKSPAGILNAAAVNGDLCTDAVLAMMGAAMVADGDSRFVQIRNLQFKECDRVREPIAELRKVYATVLPSGDPAWRRMAPEKAIWFEPDDDPDTIDVWGAPQGFAGGVDVDGRGDHRVIMMLSIVALRCRDGLRIHGAEHVAKSFPGWFETLRAMGAEVELVG
jgi:3-phosphoshikimate 1-carboxyvinyltransferase